MLRHELLRMLLHTSPHFRRRVVVASIEAQGMDGFLAEGRDYMWAGKLPRPADVELEFRAAGSSDDLPLFVTLPYPTSIDATVAWWGEASGNYTPPARRPALVSMAVSYKRRGKTLKNRELLREAMTNSGACCSPGGLCLLCDGPARNVSAVGACTRSCGSSSF
jgi:hypothetical protein